MRLLVLSLVTLAGALYVFAALEVYREEARARELPAAAGDEPSLHPEANLRRLREAFASEEYTDELEPYLEHALAQAPTFYQPPFLLAAFYANRLEQPELIESSFEAALARFPSNGRLHLTYAEWLLTPRTSAPYRLYRADDTGTSYDEARERAIQHVAQATALEPDLARRSLDVLLRFRVPMSTWTDVLPDDETTRRLVLHAADRAGGDRETRVGLLTTYLAEAQSGATLRAVVRYARKWEEAEIALSASERWHELALEGGAGPELTRATLALARELLDEAASDQAFRVMRDTLTAMEERGFAEDSAELLVGMGDLYLARAQLAMAQSLFTEAATRFPAHAPAYLGLAHVHRRAGDREAAIAELRRVLELNPQNNQARSLLDAMLEQN